MPLIDFYEKEIRYFLDESHRFAEAYPDQAKALNLEDVKNRDPFAERLIEAFAFLSGSIKQQIEDDFSGLAQKLIGVIWPHYLYPLPASTIMSFTPIKGRIQSFQLVEAGTTIESGNVSTEQPCRFTTTAPVVVRPIELSKVGLVSLNDGRSSLQITVSPSNGIKWDKIGRQPLLLYIHGDPGFAYSIYFMLCRDVKQILLNWTLNGSKRTKKLPLNLLKTSASDLEIDYPLLPYSEHSFKGFRLLEEYFFFPEKFKFFSVDIFENIDILDDDCDINIQFILSGQEDWRFQPGINNFKLHCAPSINLFHSTAEPIHIDDSKLFYKVEVDHALSNHSIPHHIKSVTGLRIDSNERFRYNPFYSYRHGLEEPVSYYHVKRQLGVDGKQEILLGIIRPYDVGPEVLSIDLMCTNNSVVKEVRLGDIDKPYQNLPDSVRASNLTVPTEPSWPNLDGNELWTLINALALNYGSLEDPNRLKNMLMLYDRTKSRANRLRVNGIQQTNVKPVETLIKGFPVRGISIEMTMNEKNFINRGDMLMFSNILSQLLSMYVPINAYCSFSVVEKDKKGEYEWPIKGEQKIL